MPFFNDGSVSLRYKFSPKGSPHSPVLVLIHEMGGALESWDAVAGMLGDVSTLQYDCRGSGFSEKVTQDYDHDVMSNDLLKLVNKVCPGRQLVLAGNAFGAGIALDFAGRHPELVSHVVALAPAIGVEPAQRPARLASADGIERDGVRAFGERLAASGYPVNLRTDPAAYEEFLGRTLANDARSFAAAMRLVANSSLQDRLGDVRCPVTLAAGTFDRTRPPEMIEDFAKFFAEARVAVLPSGHFMHVQTPAEVAELIAQAMAAVGSGDRLESAPPGSGGGLRATQ
jgi:3-oxoadipate enol-lactonase